MDFGRVFSTHPPKCPLQQNNNIICIAYMSRFNITTKFNDYTKTTTQR